MKHILLIAVFMVIIVSSVFLAEPSFNGNSPGCAGGSCHTLVPNAVTATPQANLQVSVQVNGVSSGKNLSGELVDENNNVVDVVNNTNSNPFILTAPNAQGTYTVNAGYKSPREFGTDSVSFTPTGINFPSPDHSLSTFDLMPNHPNPFNNQTIIRFAVPKTARVKLNIFDLNGKHIRTLTEDYYQKGIHSVRWNGKNDDGLPVASGVYLYQITSGEQRLVRSMIFSK